jgi:hypothetical protein
VSASGGVPTAASALDRGETNHYRPSFLPDGKHFLFSAIGGEPGASIYVGSLNSSSRTLVMHAGLTGSTNVRYAHGHLLFLREQTLMAQPFDARRLTLSGDPFPVAEQIQSSGNAATPHYSRVSEFPCGSHRRVVVRGIQVSAWRFERLGGGPCGSVGREGATAATPPAQEHVRVGAALTYPGTAPSARASCVQVAASG